MSISSVSLHASPIHVAKTGEDMLLMGPGVYIHGMTPAMAHQWIETLTPIAKEHE